MYRYIRSASTDNTPKSFGYGPVMKYDNERIRKTNLTAYEYGKNRIVYEDVDKTNADGSKKLYYKFNNGLHGTSYRYCFDPEHPDRERVFEQGVYFFK